MNTSVSLELDKRRIKQNGTFPIKILVVRHTKSLRLSTGYSTEEKHWNSKSQSIKTSCKLYPNITRINKLLQKQRLEIVEIITRLQDEERLSQMSLQELRTQLQNKQAAISLFAFCTEIIADLKQAKKHGNARVYDTMMRAVQRFTDGKDVPLQSINYRWLTKFEAWYLGNGNTLNGLSVQLRTLRALCNKAIKQKRLDKSHYPFADYSIKQEPTRKRAMSSSDLEKLKTFEPTTKREQWAKDYFFMSFYLMGVSFIDLAFLRYENIIDGRIEYKRRKTGKLHSIKITAALQTVLDRYIIPNPSPRDFVLNILTSEETAQQYRSVQTKLRLYNRTLKKIGQKAGVTVPITSYVSRHTFATIAKFKDVPVSVISQALGHSSTQMTEVYLSEFDNKVLDDYNDLVVGE